VEGRNKLVVRFNMQWRLDCQSRIQFPRVETMTEPVNGESVVSMRSGVVLPAILRAKMETGPEGAVISNAMDEDLQRVAVLVVDLWCAIYPVKSEGGVDRVSACDEFRSGSSKEGNEEILDRSFGVGGVSCKREVGRDDGEIKDDRGAVFALVFKLFADCTCHEQKYQHPL